MERTSIAFTTTLLASAPAHASHPPQTVTFEGAARGDRAFVVAPDPAAPSRPGLNARGYALARQAVEPRPALRSGRALSRILYLAHDGAVLLPGDNDARTGRSTIVTEPVFITPWDVDDDTWADTVACVRDMYARFDVVVTDRDPGDVPHIEAIFGGHPGDVGLPDYVAGVSPFTTDCSVIESSIVFTFTDVLDDDAQVMCEIMSQEIAHSFGLDHQMLAEDPMTYLDYDGDRTFQDTMADCGEFESRECGIAGSVCRDRQNSVALLASRLGMRGAEDASEDLTTTTEPEVGGCAASGSGGPLGLGVVATTLLAVRRRRRRRGN